MNFSVGILYSVQTFLRFIYDTPLKVEEFYLDFKTFQATSSYKVLSVAEECNWIQFDCQGNIIISKLGYEILDQENMQNGLRIQMKHLIQQYKPSWSYLIPKGRKESIQYFPKNVLQCFREAELILSYDPDVIEWWDSIASIIRGIRQDTNLEIGRIGEKLSINYEKKRTGKIPMWQSIESNLTGFDILSSVSSADTSPLRIEVKTTTSYESFIFYLSSNEWHVAETTAHYCFHLWVLKEHAQLYILDKKDMLSHIPYNQGKGKWEKIKVTLDIKNLKGKHINQEGLSPLGC